MALESANQGALHTGQRITWTRTDGTAQDLTGATMTGRITPVMSPAAEEFAITGTLTPVSGSEDEGVFDWAYSAGDVAEWGTFLVQFKATYGVDGYDLSDPAEWVVKKAV
jgi:hypothetical protein